MKHTKICDLLIATDDLPKTATKPYSYVKERRNIGKILGNKWETYILRADDEKRKKTLPWKCKTSNPKQTHPQLTFILMICLVNLITYNCTHDIQFQLFPQYLL